MLGGADNPNGELLSYIIGADKKKLSLLRLRQGRRKCGDHLQSAGHLQAERSGVGGLVARSDREAQ